MTTHPTDPDDLPSDFCCEHSWEAAKALAWKQRDTN
jgi:hypothetical protein